MRASAAARKVNPLFTFVRYFEPVSDRPSFSARPTEIPGDDLVEELGDDDILEEIAAFEVQEAPAGPASMVPVATHPTLPPAPVSRHRDATARVVLVVEDDATIRTMIVRGLGIDYTVYEADDGVTALHILSRIPAPACIVSDWMMPRMDGVALLKAIRADKDLKRIPVILLTAKSGPMAVIEGINAGARAYLPKPFRIRDLMDKVGLIVGKRA